MQGTIVKVLVAEGLDDVPVGVVAVLGPTLSTEAFSADPVAQERGGLRWDGLFSYQPTPGTVFFFGYGSTFFSPQFFDRQLLDRTRDGFFLKASYLFRM